jgi:5-formyltetrahydrofolate cyclo-ligase
VTSFGACEPVDGDVLDPAAIDVIVTPGVAFDRSGRRVGYGGGFYDRFFPRTRQDSVRIAIAFDVQVVDDDLPNGHFDLRVDAVVTESGVVRIEPTR